MAKVNIATNKTSNDLQKEVYVKIFQPAYLSILQIVFNVKVNHFIIQQ
jgi:hypothetical protein